MGMPVGAIGDSWILPAPGDPSNPCSRHLLRDWWRRAEERAEVSHVRGRGWHSLRRKFATELKHVLLKDLCSLGGWKEPQTVLKCYQRPDECTMRDAMEQRGRLLATGLVETNRHRESTPRPVLEGKENPA